MLIAENSQALREALQSVSTSLKQIGVDSPLREAEILLCSVLGCNRSKLYLNLNQSLSFSQQELLANYVDKRIQRIPVQYITGQQSFRYLTLSIDPRALIPRPETELLVEMVIEFIKDHESPTVIDLGTGSGAIALSIAYEVPRSKVIAIDNCPKALELARQNVSKLNLKNRVNLMCSDLFTELGAELEGKVDVVVSNPPYLKSAEIENLMCEVKDFEPRIALDGGENGLDYIREIVNQAPYFLRSEGLLAMEVGYGQAEETAKIIEAADNYSRIEIKKDYSGIDRIITAKLVSSA